MTIVKRFLATVLSLSMLLLFAAAADIPFEDDFNNSAVVELDAQEPVLDMEDLIETDSFFIPQDELEAIDPDAEEYESDAEGSVERAAVGSAAFDYSTIDDINKFDLYQEKMQNSHDGISCVPATANFTNADNELRTDRCRFGAFLRSSDERQRYYIYNAPYDHQLYSNVFTIYADSEVRFLMTDYDNREVFNEVSALNNNKVRYYKKSRVDGHNVYYIELEQAPVGASEQKIVFYTDSETVQPHYSFWFGEPLLIHKKVNAGSFSVSASTPSTSSLTYTINSPSTIPERAWVTHVNVKRKSISGAKNIRGADIKLIFPDGRARYKRATISEITLSGGANSALAFPAKGKYRFSLDGIRWETTASLKGGSVSYQGLVEIEYAYAFGA